MPSIDQLLTKYFELDVREEEMSKRHGEEMKPLSEAKAAIKNYLLHQMNEMGTDQFKVQGLGLAYKNHQTSCQMADAQAFKQFVFAPAVDAVVDYLTATGYGIRPMDIEPIKTAILTMTKWDMVDFRAGKTGIKEYIANENQPVPGININTIATVNIRRA